jgi:hypothetical protein
LKEKRAFDHADRVVDNVNASPTSELEDLLLPVGLCIVYDVIRAAVFLRDFHFRSRAGRSNYLRAES